MPVYTRSMDDPTNHELNRTINYWCKKFILKMTKKMNKLDSNPGLWESIKIIRSIYINLIRSMKYMFNCNFNKMIKLSYNRNMFNCNFNKMIKISYNRTYYLEKDLINELTFCINNNQTRYILFTVNTLKKFRDECRNYVIILYSKIPSYLPLDIKKYIVGFVFNL